MVSGVMACSLAEQIIDTLSLKKRFCDRFALAQVLLDEARAQIIFGVVFYALTCPGGVVLAIIVNASLGDNYDHATYELATGILDAIAGGILIYMPVDDYKAHHYTRAAAVV